jgi:hypothetical protein
MMTSASQTVATNLQATLIQLVMRIKSTTAVWGLSRLITCCSMFTTTGVIRSKMIRKRLHRSYHRRRQSNQVPICFLTWKRGYAEERPHMRCWLLSSNHVVIYVTILL